MQNQLHVVCQEVVTGTVADFNSISVIWSIIREINDVYQNDDCDSTIALPSQYEIDGLLFRELLQASNK